MPTWSPTDDRTRIRDTINERSVDLSVGELRGGAITGYVGDYITPSYRFDRAVPGSEMPVDLDLEDETTPSASGVDWYYLRVRQTSDQWAWSSPVWVEGGRA